MAKSPLSVNFTVESHKDQVLALTEQAARRKVAAMGMAVRTKLLMEVLVGERNGRWYRVPKTKRRYRASAPGEAPASRTGDLRRSYRVGQVQSLPGVPGAIVKVGSPLAYAAHLESGTQNMASRQHLGPAVELAKPDMEAILRGDWGI